MAFGSISGVVEDKITVKALVGVQVTITPNGGSLVTGTDGNFNSKTLMLSIIPSIIVRIMQESKANILEACVDMQKLMMADFNQFVVLVERYS